MWRVPKIWKDGDCWIIGGGHSILEQFEVPDEIIKKVINESEPMSIYSPYLSAIHDKHVIAVNAAYLLGDWIDMVFFGDIKFFLANRKALAAYPKLKITCHNRLNKNKYIGDRIKYLAMDAEYNKGITPMNNKVSWNANSGGAAISLAAHTGVKRIFLLGFDMRFSDNKRAHFHRHYVAQNKGLKPVVTASFHQHLLGFPKIARDALERGIEILNVNPDSRIPDFKKITLKEALQL